MTNTLSEAFKYVISLLPVFSGFLYYVGRRFIESYYETLGVPNEALHYSVADYLYISIQYWTFLIAIALTYLVYVLWQSVYKRKVFPIVVPNQVPKKKSKDSILKRSFRLISQVLLPKKGDPQFMMVLMYFYFIVTLVLILMWVLPTSAPNFIIEAFSEVFLLISVIWFAWIIMKDKPTIDYIRSRKWLVQIFITSIIFAVVVSTQFLPHGLGRFVGVIQTIPNNIEEKFPNIKVALNLDLWNQDIDWIEQDGVYVTDDIMILILQNESGVFVKTIIIDSESSVLTRKKISDTYYFPQHNIEGLKLDIPGRFPEY